MFARDLTKKFQRYFTKSEVKTEKKSKILKIFKLDLLQKLKFLKIWGQRVGIDSEGFGLGFQSSEIWDFNIIGLSLSVKNFEENESVMRPFW